MIFLDNQTSPMLKTLLKKEIEAHPLNFIASRLLKMVEEDEARKEKIKTCEHTYQPMYGFHKKCQSCGGLENGFELWVNEELRETGSGQPTSRKATAIPHSTPAYPNQSTIL